MLLDLISGRRTREEVDEWAGRWVYASDPGVDDQIISNALTSLAVCDLKTSPDGYLHGPDDFRDWLRDFDDELAGRDDN
ncbi:DNA-binding protein [Amycolatopsis anabasis]|uniref:DNA-binding protein n=1 Tax=Amycolatopsis anabasis TaxID=1840409 RepID=UPI00131B3333|nr:DNA-binding protein [Amycolatopsis anabasis]